jgi:hypothetical protein
MKSGFDSDEDEHLPIHGASPRRSELSDDEEHVHDHDHDHDHNHDHDGADTASARSVSLSSPEPTHAVFAIPLDAPEDHDAHAENEEYGEDDMAEEIPLSPADDTEVPLAAQAALALRLDVPAAAHEESEYSARSFASSSYASSSPGNSPHAAQTGFIVPDEDEPVAGGETHIPDVPSPQTAIPDAKRASQPFSFSDRTSVSDADADARSLYTDEVDLRDSPLSSVAPSLAPSVGLAKPIIAEPAARGVSAPTTYPPRPPVESRDSRASIMSTTSASSRKIRPESMLNGVQGPLVLGLALVDFNHIVRSLFQQGIRRTDYQTEHDRSGPGSSFRRARYVRMKRSSRCCRFWRCRTAPTLCVALLGRALCLCELTSCGRVRKTTRTSTLFLPPPTRPLCSAYREFTLNLRGCKLSWPRCNRQISAADLLVKDADVTRSTVQKAVVVLATIPIFGLLRYVSSCIPTVLLNMHSDRLGVITRALFDQQ